MMEQIDMTKYLPCTARLVGGTLYILDGEGRVQRRLDPLQTAIEWFQTVSYTHLDVYKRQQYEMTKSLPQGETGFSTMCLSLGLPR